jgi:phosphate/sulfate permease
MEKTKKWRAILGVVLIILGIIIASGGVPSEIDSNVLDPTYLSMGVGLLVALMGYLLGRKHFKYFLD